MLVAAGPTFALYGETAFEFHCRLSTQLLQTKLDSHNESLDTTGRYLARLHQGELRHHARLAALYGLEAPVPSAEDG